MVISEFLPNPVGKDTEGEWVKLFNDGKEEVNLGQWHLKDASGKVFYFKDIDIKPGEYLSFGYQTTKIPLNNNDETLFLFDKNNNLIDQLGFSGAINEGEVVKKDRGLADIATNSIQNQNSISQIVNLSDKSAFGLNFLLSGLAICLVLSFLGIILVKKIKINKQDNA
ncbi:MAG: lamin tail domain-containing protein [Patescibacteria group bacterium]